MHETIEPKSRQMWSLGWIVLIRAILYLVIVGFLLQYIYFGESGRIYKPGEATVVLSVAFLVNLGLLALAVGGPRIEQGIALAYIIDLLVLTRIILISGGFNSVFIPFYLPVLIMASIRLPRRFTAVFPSIATFGTAYVGLAHILVALGRLEWARPWYPDGLLYLYRFSPATNVVSNMLILTVLFFVVSYVSGILSDRLFVEQRLNAEVLSSMSEGVAVVDSKGILSYANAEFFRLFPEAAALNDFRPVITLMFRDSDDEFILERLLERDLTDSHLVTRNAGETTGRPPMEIKISGLSLYGKADVYGLVFLVTDLSLRIRMEEAERDVARFASISTMAAGLAHEIRNPLASLRSAIQEIGESFPPKSQNRLLADVVIAESDRLDRVIGRFLDFSREGELRLSRVRLEKILDEIKMMLPHIKEGKDVVLTVDVLDDPEVLCDSDRIKEVFINLSLNAVQFLPKEGGRLTIRMGSTEKGLVPGVEILFMDNGPGIRENDLPRLFEPFFSKRHGGTGMGLALSRKQVAMHGGQISAGNRASGGAWFRVWLPLKAAKPSVGGCGVSGRQTEVRPRG